MTEYYYSGTKYIEGWPSQLWEALLSSIDAKAFLYALSHGGSYNVRAFSSMIGETFFSELTMNDRRGQGTVSCQEFGQFIGNTIEQIPIRLDPARKITSILRILVDQTLKNNAYNSIVIDILICSTVFYSTTSIQ